MNNNNLLPSFLMQHNRELKELVRTGQVETSNFNKLIQDLKRQCFIDKATWGLDFWEETLNIEKDIDKTNAGRRTIIKAKLRGLGTTTKKVIEEVAESFIEGKAEVIEYPKKYYFNLIIESVKGFPYKADDLYKAIDEIKPAHLGTQYKFISKTKDNIKLGTILRTAETITIYPYNPKEVKLKGNFKIPIGSNAGLENITIYPKKVR